MTVCRVAVILFLYARFAAPPNVTLLVEFLRHPCALALFYTTSFDAEQIWTVQVKKI